MTFQQSSNFKEKFGYKVLSCLKVFSFTVTVWTYSQSFNKALLPFKYFLQCKIIRFS